MGGLINFVWLTLWIKEGGFSQGLSWLGLVSSVSWVCFITTKSGSIK